MRDDLQPASTISIDFTPVWTATSDSLASIAGGMPVLRASNPNDQFTYQDNVYELIRFYPNPDTIRETSPETVQFVEIPTTSGNLNISALITAQAGDLINVTWIDDNNEPIGTWIPRT